METINECHIAMERTGDGVVGDIDWSVVAPLEQVLKKQHRQVIGELEEIAEIMRFEDISEAKRAVRVRPERVVNLLTLEYHLLLGLSEWKELMLCAKRARNELDLDAIAKAHSSLDDYRLAAQRASRSLLEARTVPRRPGLIRKLMTDGIVIGGMKDERVATAAREVREAVQAVAVTANQLPSRQISVLEYDRGSE